MSRTRLIKRTAKISVKAQMFINAFLMIGINNLITPIMNPVTEIINKTVAKIVNAVMMFNFNVNIYLFLFLLVQM